MKVITEQIQRYAHDHTRPRPRLFEELREYTFAHVPYPQMQVGRVEGTLLKMLASLLGAHRIVEIGCYTGYSTLCMAEALPRDGLLITCDVNEEYTAVARKFWSQSPHGSKIELRLGKALESLETLEAGSFDMAFIDADKTNYPAYYEKVLSLLRSGGLMVFDNALWGGSVVQPETDSDKAIAAVNERAMVDDRVENVMLTVRDGMLLVRKK